MSENIHENSILAHKKERKRYIKNKCILKYESE
jgi:hypothetical protein